MADQVLTKHSSNIPRKVLTLLREIGEHTQHPVCLVGGFVRDILLGRESLDLDIVVEGDAIKFAEELGTTHGWEVRTHDSFGTASVLQNADIKIDFASARSETYVHPGALPLVSPGKIRDDLLRRDFSINALAIRLNTSRFGELVDYSGGAQDLRLGRVCTLHPRSFIDDPTRIFRAARYEKRYGFRIVEEDQQRIHEAIGQGVLGRISGERIRNEINRVLAEATAPLMVKRLCEFDIFRVVHPEWEVTSNFKVHWTAVQEAIDWASTRLSNEKLNVELLAWMSLFYAAKRDSVQCGFAAVPTHVIQEITDRLVLPHRLRKLFHSGLDLQMDLSEGRSSIALQETFQRKKILLSDKLRIRQETDRWILTDKQNKQAYLIRKVRQRFYVYDIQTEISAYHRLSKSLTFLSVDSKASDVYLLLEPYPLETLVFSLMQPDQPRWRMKQIQKFLVDLRKAQSLINGDDLMRLGLKPGKAFTAILKKAFAAQLDGRISTKVEAYEFLGLK